MRETLETSKQESLETGPILEPMPFGFPPRRIDPGYVQTEWADLPPVGVLV